MAPANTDHRWWLIDDVSTVPGWAYEVKNLRDNDPDFSTDTVILTGSSAHDLTEATSSLAGRRGPVSRPDRTLLPMGFRTFANLMLASRATESPQTPRLEASALRTPQAASVFNNLLPWESELTAWWEIYLQVGGFPRSVSSHITGHDAGHVAQTLFDVVHRDAFGATAMPEQLVQALLARLAENLASPVNVSAVATDVGVSQFVATSRLDDLAAAYAMWPCPASVDLLPAWRSQSKRYFVDPLFARLAHLRNAAFPAPDSTVLTEQQLGMALLRAAEAATPGVFPSFDQVMYERTPTRKEIDFVGPGLSPVAIEGKYTDTGRWVGEAATVNASRYAGILATRGTLDTSATSPDRAWAVPAALLAYTIDV
jgi:predicted AAA+ superfamily ATPase